MSLNLFFFYFKKLFVLHCLPLLNVGLICKFLRSIHLNSDWNQNEIINACLYATMME